MIIIYQYMTEYGLKGDIDKRFHHKKKINDLNETF